MGSMAGSANSRTGKLVMSTPAPPPYCLATCNTYCMSRKSGPFYMASRYIKMDKTSNICTVLTHLCFE